MSARTYTTRGDVCGGCDHTHRTLQAAQACADKHHAAIVRHNTRGAYSDRRVAVLSPGDEPRHLTDWEREQLASLDEVQL